MSIFYMCLQHAKIFGNIFILHYMLPRLAKEREGRERRMGEKRGARKGKGGNTDDSA